MIVTRVFGENWRSYEAFDVELLAGTTAIIGPNGAGKSSLLAAVEVALFGPPSAGRDRSMRRYLNRASASTEVMVGVEVEHHGERYRIRRGYSARGAGKPTLDFDCAGPIESDWEPLTRESTDATQQAIDEAFGISRRTLRASALLMQGDSAAFCEADAAERKRILADILHLDAWDDLHARAKTDRKQLAEAIAVLDAEIARADEQLAARPETEEKLRATRWAHEEASNALHASETRLAEAEQALAEARERAAARAQQAQLAAAAQRALDDAVSRRDATAARITKGDAYTAQRDALDGLASQIDDLEGALAARRQAHEAWRAQKAERAGLEAEARRLRSEVFDAENGALGAAADAREANQLLAQLLDADQPECPTCGQHIEGDARSRTLKAVEDREIAALERQQEHKRRERDAREAVARTEQQRDAIDLVEPLPLDDLEHTLARAREAQTQLARIDEATRHLALLREELHELEALIPDLRRQVEQTRLPDDEDMARAELATLDRRAGACWTTVVSDRDLTATLSSQIARLEERVALLDRIADQAAAAHASRAELHDRLDVVAVLERAYSRDGVPAWRVEQALPALEAEASRILSELGASMRVELPSQRATQAGKLVETLGIDVVTPTGTAAYETLSGGEKSRVNLALRIALARLLAGRRGAEIGLLAIDEIEHLDAAGTERLVDVLRGLETTFRSILLISHHDGLRDAFPAVIEIAGGADTGEPSRIAEAVPA